MVRTTGVLNMIMMSFIAIPLVTVAWLLAGYTLAFSGDARAGSSATWLTSAWRASPLTPCTARFPNCCSRPSS